LTFFLSTVPLHGKMEFWPGSSKALKQLSRDFSIARTNKPSLKNDVEMKTFEVELA